MASKQSKKTKILFVDSKNDLSSQLAEYFVKQTYPNLYDVYSAGPEKDMVDCDLLSVMYCQGEDLRNQASKDFFEKGKLPKDEELDYIVYTEKGVFDEFAGKSPWQGKQILAHMGSRQEFTATDDAELARDLLAMADRVREWVRVNLDDPEKLKAMVTR